MEKQKRKEYKYKDLNEMCWDLKQNPPKRTKGEKKIISKLFQEILDVLKD